ncbi:type VI secretion system ATPase TssH [Polymorphobacter fuscus]|uniref:Type VI secretion system ATPase TssH n=1 Tax=Sandarakinorhabdus fusca TaxID=1439888 RepID=A0A7C9LEB5_9SPHN|nr:type VI secretion system ATPase TssH [Polymorphobacter fuscus]KAB7648278.1 type VI secretion system ATPase TssH [Polymorphobacter fuscus]MQT15787.1 type VI secretion system ATPase TssH [Polymorphobacter fuscus]NJC07940.1 type VI secretion system protein VasG [Polymorphobacter fuscus]
MAISRSGMVSRLGPKAMTGLQTAHGFAKLRENPYVEIAHWLHALNADKTSEITAIKAKFGIDDGKIASDIVAALDKLPRGASSLDFSQQLMEAVQQGWMYASLQFNAARVSPGHALYALLASDNLRTTMLGISKEWRKVDVEQLGEHYAAITGSAAEAAPAAGGGGDDTGAAGAPSGESALARYSVDLTARARSGEIDKIVGRDAEIRQVVDILLRRRQNNPILTGEAGVGKTAVAEGFARRIVDGDVPPSLANVTLRSLDIGLLQAGASVKGEFEKRLRQVIDEVEASPVPIILFIDEAHTLIGAGGSAGTGDAANLLKPALARGKLRTIAATTWAEYRQYFEKDPALTRRFQTVAVGEPETDNAIAMLRSVSDAMVKHHKVIVLDEALEAAVKLSQRYIPSRQLPDKAVSLLDTACARVGVSQHATPAPVEDRLRKVERLEVELGIATREADAGMGPVHRPAEIEAQLVEARATLADVRAKWEAEKAAVAAVIAARTARGDARAAAAAAPAPDADAPDFSGHDDALRTTMDALHAAQGDSPMVFAQVDANAVAAVVGDWTGVPVGRMVKDEITSVLTIADNLKKRVIGQDHGLEAIAKRIQTSRAKLDNPNKPVGVFMLCGPSGVGKTETAHALAELLYAGDDSMIVINMSEFQEAHTVSTLKGAPAGYVGYGQGGVLTEAVRRRPYSVVLLDEVEKAHPDVHEMFFQVFDKGYMDDSEGRYIDFKNCLILLTSNAGTDLITDMASDPETAPDPEALATALRPELLKVFPPALLGRLIVLPYYPLSPEMLGGIVKLQLNRIVRRIAENHKIALTYDQAVVDHIVGRCTEMASGGRMIDAILTNSMLPTLSTGLLGRMADGVTVEEIAVSVRGDDLAYDFKDAAMLDAAA